MELTNQVQNLRELIRSLERKLGLLDDLQASCCGITFTQCHAVVEIGRAGGYGAIRDGAIGDGAFSDGDLKQEAIGQQRRISLNDLADLLGLDKSTMSRTIQNLVNQDLAVRELDPADRRYVTIALTDKGIKAYQEIEAGMEAYFNSIYHWIPETKREQVLESLELLLQALIENDCCQTIRNRTVVDGLDKE